ncbi:ankyrin repeat-containing protein, putative [Entamoeba invadens IP1]|uniref:Ankyrin repeat-containing protein, putative n=1 Tax=Entamoeba invadens IP1 TaxID=370355 RepID=A0A0A1U4S3_ENTIV|nr:ankyrin repeat-containing protein, putative [Entamoeba invadens IP1]ELP89262.1 ankyrin repeat-containing protein, putative [Entamoeba invadens IP1]|eukprot:XP_004256033.1 ankyrin repeat-containing protein, putative [Entamoeba invadens IP1]
MDKDLEVPLSPPLFQFENTNVPLPHAFLISHRPEFIDFYLDENPDKVNYQDIHGNTALMVATRMGLDSLIELLLSRGAQPNIQNEDGMVALFVALLYNKMTSATVLIKEMKLSWTSRFFGTRDTYGYTILHYLALTNGLEEWAIKYKLQRFVEDNSNIMNETPLIVAAKNKNSNAVKGLLRLGADPNKGNSDGVLPLMFALQRADVESCKTLFVSLKNNAYTDKNGKQLFHYAIKSGNIKIVAELLKWYGYDERSVICLQNILYEISESGRFDGFSGVVQRELKVMQIEFSKQNFCDKLNHHLVHYAIKYKIPEMVPLICVWDKIALSRPIGNRWSPFLYSCVLGEERAFDYIEQLSTRDPLNDVGADGENCLQLATYYKNLGIVKKVLTKRFELISKKDGKNNTVFHYAAAGGGSEIFDFLYKTAESRVFNLGNTLVSAVNTNGENVLHTAVSSGNGALAFRLIMNYKIDPKSVDFQGNGVLHHAVLGNPQESYVMTLLLRYFDALPKNKKGYSPLQLCCLSGNYTNLSDFLKLGKTIFEEKDEKGRTVLHLACLLDDPFVVDELMKNNVNTQQVDKLGKKPENYARSVFIYRRIRKEKVLPIGKVTVCKSFGVHFQKGNVVDVVFENEKHTLTLWENQLKPIQMQFCKKSQLSVSERNTLVEAEKLCKNSKHHLFV